MRRLVVIWIFAIAFAGVVGSAALTDVDAQSDDVATPSISGTPSTPAASDTVWFVIIPEGKTNGEYFDVTLKPGESATLSATIGNGSEVPVKALMYAADAYSGTNGGLLLNNADVPVTDPTTWLDFPTTSYDFQPKEAFEQKFTVTVPENTAPGQYITGIAIETADASQMEGDAPFLVKYRLVSPVLITVPGPITAKFELGDISVVVDDQTTTINGAIENTGNIRVRPEGTLTLKDANGAQVVEAQIAMSSVYAGDQTNFQILLPAPLAEGTYIASVDLKDPDTGAVASLSGQEVTVAKPVAPAPVSITNVTIAPMPSADNVVFAQVSATIVNTGSPVAGGELSLQVFRDGEQIDDQVLATSMTLQNGETVIDQSYIPQSGSWDAGSYTFQLTLSSIDPSSGTKSVIATTMSDVVIEVP